MNQSVFQTDEFVCFYRGRKLSKRFSTYNEVDEYCSTRGLDFSLLSSICVPYFDGKIKNICNFYFVQLDKKLPF